MKIIHIISSLDKGGAETYLAMLCKYQIEKNKVVVIYLKGNGYWAKKLSKLGITVIFINFKKVYNISQFILSFYKIKKIIKNHRPDIVHAHLRLPELILFLIKLFNKKFKMIITKHLDSFFMEGSSLFISGLTRKSLNGKHHGSITKAKQFYQLLSLLCRLENFTLRLLNWVMLLTTVTG